MATPAPAAASGWPAARLLHSAHLGWRGLRMVVGRSSQAEACVYARPSTHHVLTEPCEQSLGAVSAIVSGRRQSAQHVRRVTCGSVCRELESATRARGPSGNMHLQSCKAVSCDEDMSDGVRSWLSYMLKLACCIASRCSPLTSTVSNPICISFHVWGGALAYGNGMSCVPHPAPTVHRAHRFRCVARQPV